MGNLSTLEGELGDSRTAAAWLTASSYGRKDSTAMPRVLVADDDPVALESLAFLLSEHGYEVIRASNGCDALRQLEAGDGPDLAVLDWMMPDLDGKEICQRLRASNSSRYIYMILVTARDESAAVVEALGAGADDYIRKPFDPQELRARLDAGNRIIVQRALRESEERFHSAFESAGTGMALVDFDGHFRQVNQTLCDYLGFTSEELRASTFQAITHPDDLPKDLLALEELTSGTRKTYQAEKRYIHKQGHAVWAHLMVSVVHNADGRPAGLFSQVQDITERRRLEDQLRQAQKLEAIGQLAAGLSHEINTPTQYVSDNIGFLTECWPVLDQFICLARRMHEESGAGGVAPETIAQVGACMQKADLDYLLAEIPRAIEQSLDGLQRVAKIVRAMKEFSHPGSEEKRATDINHAIQTTITVARNEWKYVAEVETSLDPNLPPVPCLAGGFNQVILNLLINAAHAIQQVVGDGSQGKGKILITTKQDHEWVEVSLHDTGKGSSSGYGR